MSKTVSLIKSILLLVCLYASFAVAETHMTVGVDSISAPDTQVRYLSNYSTETPWSDKQAWVNFSTDYTFGRYTASLKGSVNSSKKPYISEASVSYNYDYTSGFAAGIRQFKQSWCRTYELNNVWINEPDVFCRFKGLAEMSEGAYGLQYYKNAKFGDWSVDTQLGFYNPLVDKQSSRLGPYVAVGPITYNRKAGVGVDVLNTKSGSSYRASLMRSELQQISYDQTYLRHLIYNSYFLGGEWSVMRQLSVRYTVAGYVGDQIDPSALYSFNTKSTTAEIAYAINSSNTIAYGKNSYSNYTRYVDRANKQRVNVGYEALSLRTEWGNNWYSVVQYSFSTDDSVTGSGKAAYKQGDELAIRVGRRFSF